MKEILLHGDCLMELKRLEDNSVDSVVTDPPYGLSKEPDIIKVLTKWMAGEPYDHGHNGFMGKSWDSFVPHQDIWKEVFRVLKPGGHALVFAGTRTQDLMTISLRLAGFEVRDVIEWLYFSGFPKSLDVGKAFDRRRDEDLPAIYAVTKFIAEARDRAGKTNRDIDEFMGTNGMAGHWTTQGSQPQVPKLDQWYKLKGFLGMSDKMDAEVWRLNGRKGKPGDAWFEREKIGEKNYSVPKNHINAMVAAEGAKGRVIPDITTPATPLAKKWNGWGTALKPAHEPIIVARKPLIGTVAENVERFGTGAINIDGCRIPLVDEKPPTGSGKREGGGNTYHLKDWIAPNGRFPANIVTTEPDAFWSKYSNVTPENLSKKASKKDRNSTVDGRVLDGVNRHPTCKPVDLMRWLVRLATPLGGIVLDPFAGSGSTLVAAKREGFGFIGIELMEEYIPIIEARTGVKANKGTRIEEYN